MSLGSGEWFIGIPTGQGKRNRLQNELVEVLQVEMQPNALSRKLNVSLERLILEYGIQYKTERGHDGRKIRLAFVGKQA